MNPKHDTQIAVQYLSSPVTTVRAVRRRRNA